MRHASIIAKATLIIITLCAFSGAQASAAVKKAPLGDKEKAGLVVGDFLKLMDAKQYDKAFLLMDFDKIIKDQLGLDPAALSPKDKENQIKNIKEVIKKKFELEKKKVKFRNFSIGAFKRTGGTATVELINTPPAGQTGKPIVKTFRLILAKNAWRIYGNK